MNKDNIIFNKKFEFNNDVTNVFDDMISRNIPDYKYMRYLTNNLLLNYFKTWNTKIHIYDLGCSTGLSSEYLIKNLNNSHFTLIDYSPSMIKKCKEKFLEYKNIDYKINDIENEIDNINSGDLFISSLVIQFISKENRKKLITKIYNKLNQNGVFIFIEKTAPINNTISEIFQLNYYNIKKLNGYSEEQIYSKQNALKNYLIPLSYDENIDLLKNSGFSIIECYWKCLNFTGWICIK